MRMHLYTTATCSLLAYGVTALKLQSLIEQHDADMFA